MDQLRAESDENWSLNGGGGRSHQLDTKMTAGSSRKRNRFHCLPKHRKTMHVCNPAQFYLMDSISLWLLHIKNNQMAKHGWLLLRSSHRKHNVFVTAISADRVYKTRQFSACFHECIRFKYCWD